MQHDTSKYDALIEKLVEAAEPGSDPDKVRRYHERELRTSGSDYANFVYTSVTDRVRSCQFMSFPALVGAAILNDDGTVNHEKLAALVAEAVEVRQALAKNQELASWIKDTFPGVRRRDYS